MLFWAQSQTAAQNGYWWWWSCRPASRSPCSAPSLALLNFGIDEFVNPGCAPPGCPARQARKAGLPRRFPLGVTPVTRPRAPVSPMASSHPGN